MNYNKLTKEQLEEIVARAHNDIERNHYFKESLKNNLKQSKRNISKRAFNSMQKPSYKNYKSKSPDKSRLNEGGEAE